MRLPLSEPPTAPSARRPLSSRNHGGQRDPEAPVAPTQLSLDQGSHCKSRHHTTPRALCIHHRRLLVHPCRMSAGYTKPLALVGKVWASRDRRGAQRLASRNAPLTLFTSPALAAHHRLPDSAYHGIASCAQVQRLLCRPTTPHNDDHQRRMSLPCLPIHRRNTLADDCPRFLVASPTQLHRHSPQSA